MKTLPTPDARPILTPDRVAEMLGPGWSRDSVVRLMETRQLRAVDKGRGRYRHWRTSEAWLAEFKAGRGQTVRFAPARAVPASRPSPILGLEFAQIRRT